MSVTEGSDLQHARRAVGVLSERFASTAWWRGAGLVPVLHGWVVRVDVAEPRPELPLQVDGVPLEVRVVGDATARPETD